METEKLSIFQTALALVASNIGGGILGFPFAYYHCGLFLGLILTLIMATLSHFSTLLYLKTKDLTPRRYESVYEIAYLLLGRPSIFIVCAVMFASNLGSIVMYYILIGETWTTLTTQFFVSPVQDSITGDQVTLTMEDFPPLA